MSAVAKAIWLIENRFREPLPLDELADHAGVSRSHLSRLFPLVTGITLSGYIRARRLSEAARRIAAGAPDILAIALEFGYGSHEAFTRAFRDQFGLTPDALRRRGTLDSLPLMDPLRMAPHQTVTLAPPVIEDRPAMRLCGTTRRYTMASSAQIPDQWAQFTPHIMAAVGYDMIETYGIIGPMGEDGFDYSCAMPVKTAEPLDPALQQINLPATRFARFVHEGHISQIRATCAAVFETGLPQAGLVHAPQTFSFLEYYSPAFDPAVGVGGVEVWVPVQR